MTVKTTYTLNEFIDWLDHQLQRQGILSDFLKWDVSNGSYDDIAEDTLITFGVTDIADIDGLEDVKRLRAIGRLKLWTAVQEALATEHTYSADKSSHSRDQIFDHVSLLVNRAETDALPYLDQGIVEITPVSYSDSYEWDPLTKSEYSQW